MVEPNSKNVSKTNLIITYKYKLFTEALHTFKIVFIVLKKKSILFLANSSSYKNFIFYN